MFFRDLFSPSTSERQQLVKPETAKAMRNFSQLTNSWCTDCNYGLGTFNEPQYEDWARRDKKQLYRLRAS